MASYITDIAARIMKIPAGDRPAIIGIDGPGASGKSILADGLAKELKECAVVHFDDFYLPEAKGEGYGIRFNWRRLECRVLIPAMEGRRVRYRKIDWSTGRLSEWVSLVRPAYLIVEGVYSLRAELREYYDFRILVSAPYAIRLDRGVRRDGEAMRSMWVDSWMPEEAAYFASAAGPAETADTIVDGTKISEAIC